MQIRSSQKSTNASISARPSLRLWGKINQAILEADNGIKESKAARHEDSFFSGLFKKTDHLAELRAALISTRQTLAIVHSDLNEYESEKKETPVSYQLHAEGELVAQKIEELDDRLQSNKEEYELNKEEYNNRIDEVNEELRHFKLNDVKKMAEKLTKIELGINELKIVEDSLNRKRERVEEKAQKKCCPSKKFKEKIKTELNQIDVTLTQTDHEKSKLIANSKEIDPESKKSALQSKIKKIQKQRSQSKGAYLTEKKKIKKERDKLQAKYADIKIQMGKQQKKDKYRVSETVIFDLLHLYAKFQDFHQKVSATYDIVKEKGGHEELERLLDDMRGDLESVNKGLIPYQSRIFCEEYENCTMAKAYQRFLALPEERQAAMRSKAYSPDEFMADIFPESLKKSDSIGFDDVIAARASTMTMFNSSDIPLPIVNQTQARASQPKQ